MARGIQALELTEINNYKSHEGLILMQPFLPGLRIYYVFRKMKNDTGG